MGISLNFMLSPPGESLRGFLKLLVFIIKVKLFLGKRIHGIFLNHMRIEPDTVLHDKAIQDRVLSEDHNLLPNDKDDLKKLFYKNPRTKYIDTIVSGLLWLKKEIR